MTRKKARIIAKIPFSDAQRGRLRAIGVDYVADSNPESRDDAEEILRRVSDAEAVVISISTPLKADVIRCSPTLKFIQTWSTGVDNVDLEAASAAAIVVCNVPDFSTESVAEKTLGLMILGANRLADANAHAAAGGWDYMKFRGCELRGKTLAIVGHGRIGRRVAELARAFGMSVVALGSKSGKDELHAALKRADFVTVHCPYTPATRHLLGREAFGGIKPGSTLINASRGGVVDEGALHDALEDGRVGFAAVDVFETEPPAKDHPLLRHPRAFVTPHCAWNTQEALDRLTESALENLEAYVLGRPPANRVL